MTLGTSMIAALQAISGRRAAQGEAAGWREPLRRAGRVRAGAHRRRPPCLEEPSQPARRKLLSWTHVLMHFSMPRMEQPSTQLVTQLLISHQAALSFAYSMCLRVSVCPSLSILPHSPNSAPSVAEP